MEFSVILTFIKNFIVSVAVFLGMIFTPGYYQDAKDIVKDVTVDTFKSAQTTLAYDVEGNVITKLKDEKDSYYLSFDTIPDNVKNAFVATEDKSFYSHNGVDVTGVGRAFLNLIKKGKISGGGSTITQQLSRNVFLSHEKSLERKLKEVYISVLLEKNHTKDDILEYYINSIYFNNGAYGIDAASRKYFGKSATELTLGETAFLCAIPNNPTLYNPFTNFDNTVKRQKRILGYMLEDEYISEEEYSNALEEEIVLSKESVANINSVDTYVIDCSLDILMELNGFVFKTDFEDEKEKEKYNALYVQERKEAQDKLNTGGYRIYTSIDMKKQNALQSAIDNSLSSFSDKTEEGVYAFQGAATSIDNATGKVVAIVGGRSQEELKYSFNRAFQSFRQPGSTIKPLIVYTPLFERGYYPSSWVEDFKSEDGPRNYDETYEGLVSIRYAVEHSKNTIAWNLLRELGVNNGMSYIKAMNFEKISKDDYNLAAALGGLTYGTNTLEMASAYSALARDGKYIKPTCILKIEDADGNVIYEDKSYTVDIYSEKASRIMTDVLRTTMISGTGANLQLNGMTSAGKTGSTNDNKDGWFAGYTPYYTTVVWSGYDTPKAVPDLFGSTYPGKAWQQYMNEIHVGLSDSGFAVYENLQAEEDAIKATEDLKLLDYEIRNGIYELSNTYLDSYYSISNAESLYWSLSEKVNLLTDENKKNEYNTQLSVIKNNIDEAKPWYYISW